MMEHQDGFESIAVRIPGGAARRKRSLEQEYRVRLASEWSASSATRRVKWEKHASTSEPSTEGFIAAFPCKRASPTQARAPPSR